MQWNLVALEKLLLDVKDRNFGTIYGLPLGTQMV